MNALEKMETRYGGHGTALSHDGVPNKILSSINYAG